MTQVMTLDADREKRGREPGSQRVAKSRRSLNRRASYYRALVVGGLLLAWQLAVWTGVVDERMTSSPIGIAEALWDFVTGSDAAFYPAVRETIMATVLATLYGVVIGTGIGLAVGLNRLLREAYLPIVVYLLGIPKTIFLPLFVLFFGLGSGSAIAFGAVLAFLQVAINVIGGIDMIEPKFFSLSRAYGARKTAVLWHVILPGAAPGFSAALWHGLRNAFSGVLIAQMFVSNLGIGYLVKIYTNQLQIDKSMALVVVASVLIILIGSMWEIAEARLMRWKTVRS